MYITLSLVSWTRFEHPQTIYYHQKNANAYLTLCLQPPTESDASTSLELDKNKAFSELHASLLCKKKREMKSSLPKIFCDVWL